VDKKFKFRTFFH